MGLVRIGQTEVEYELRRSATTSERRITVTPGHVEVLALANDDDEAISGFLNRKRQWLYNTLRDLEAATAHRAVVPRFITGSKIPFRGRNYRLTVRRHDGPHVGIGFQNAFVVDLPSWVREQDYDVIVASEIRMWLKRRVRRDVAEFAAVFGTAHGLKPRTLRVADMKHGWGACGPSGAVLINWHLVFAPKPILQYVVAHELAHLRHRGHGPRFWTYLGEILSTYERSKTWLDANGGNLTSDFLSTPLL